MSSPRYPEYKDSGVEWLGEVPAHWGLRRFRYCFDESSEKIENEVVGSMLSVSGYRGIEIKEYDDENRRRSEEELVGYRIVRPGQLVVNTMWMNYAGLGISDFEGHVSPAYRSYAVSTALHKRYVHHLMRSETYVKGYTKFLTGIRPNSLQMSRDDLLNFPILLPPHGEQRLIAAFLDRETSKIDGLIAEQERLIELLKEKRQAVISHAVTKGLDPDVPMKDSGVEWLGEVPAHWGVATCGRYASVLSGYAFPSSGFTTDESATRLLRGINVGVGEVKWEETVYWERTEEDGLDRFVLSVGAIVLGMDRPLISGGIRVARLRSEDVPCLLLQRVALIRPDARLDPEFLYKVLRCQAFADYFTPDLTGVSVPHISPDQILAFPIPVPPLDEQRAIARFLQDEENSLAGMTQSCGQATALLKERRSALISAAVTGQIDVRGAVLQPAPLEGHAG